VDGTRGRALDRRSHLTTASIPPHRYVLLKGGSRYSLSSVADWYFPGPIALDRHNKYFLFDDAYERAFTIGFRCAYDLGEHSPLGAAWPRGAISPEAERADRPRDAARLKAYLRTYLESAAASGARQG